MRPELPDYGTFPRWPADGDQWIHPDDMQLVLSLIPGNKIFRRDEFDGTFYHYRYGDIHFRLQPCMWLPLENEGIDIGDMVETKGLGLERELFIGTVTEAIYADEEGACMYRLTRGETIDDRLYVAHELQVLNNKTKLQIGTTEHPKPQWVEAYRGDYLEKTSEDLG